MGKEHGCMNGGFEEIFFMYKFLLYLVKFGALRCSAYEKYLPELCSVVCPMLCSANKCTRIVVSNPPEGDQLRSSGDSRCIYGGGCVFQ